MHRLYLILLAFLVVYSLAWAQGNDFQDNFVGIVSDIKTSEVSREGFNRPSMSVWLAEYPNRVFDVMESIGANSADPTKLAFPLIQKGWKVKLICIKGTQLVQRVETLDVSSASSNLEKLEAAQSQRKEDGSKFVGTVENMGNDPFVSSENKRTLVSLSKNEGQMFSIPTDVNAELLNLLSNNTKIEINGRFASNNAYLGKIYDVVSIKILEGSDKAGKEYKVEYPVAAIQPLEKTAIATGPEIIPGADDAPPSDMVMYDKPPTAIKKVAPVYPKLAARANLKGKVLALLWVDKTGIVREVRILRSDSEYFNQAVIDAAKQYVFTPATYNNEPVAVWIAMPFSFSLR